MTGKAGRRPATSTTPGRQEIWEAIRKLRTGFNVDDLIDHSCANRKTISDYLRCLVPGGIIVQCEDDRYDLVEDRGFHAPRLNRQGKPVTQGAGTENMWRSMRGLAVFSPQDLAIHSTTPDVSVSEATAKAYCGMLLKTGFLRVERKASPMRGKQAIYRLIRNTGPKPPQIQRVKHVYDPNTQQVHVPGGEV
ncbi:MDR/zinc-dependent alcohol dehydrogenase-like family protein [Paracoccus onubensis]|uniref:hypothetical protein n=1 Tax=Paracoccus onubensis TaxID=1675788 RepID=UPI0015FFD60A|nr:hypothetical protein [Paracoccus onubensis]